MKRLRAEAREELVYEDDVDDAKVSFYKHPDVDTVDRVELVEAKIHWRDGTISRFILRARVVYDVEPFVVLQGCNVDAEIRCGSFVCIYGGILNLLARLGVSEKTATVVEVHIW